MTEITQNNITYNGPGTAPRTSNTSINNTIKYLFAWAYLNSISITKYSSSETKVLNSLSTFSLEKKYNLRISNLLIL